MQKTQHWHRDTACNNQNQAAFVQNLIDIEDMTTPHITTDSKVEAEGHSPLILIGHSTATALKYKRADRGGHPFLHIPFFVYLYDKGRDNALSLTIPQISKACVQDILDAFPQGPYNLIGSCQNAIVAHEAACQLTGQGHHVARLIIIDENWNAKERPPVGNDTNGIFSRISKHFGAGGIIQAGKKSLRNH